MPEITASKIKLTLRFRCRNCNTQFSFTEGELMHERCTLCGKSKVNYVDIDGKEKITDEIWECIETGEFVSGVGNTPIVVVSE